MREGRGLRWMKIKANQCEAFVHRRVASNRFLPRWKLKIYFGNFRSLFWRQWNMSISIMPGDKPRPLAPFFHPAGNWNVRERKSTNFIQGSPKIYFDSSTECVNFIYKSASITQFLEILCSMCPPYREYTALTSTQCQAEVITVIPKGKNCRQLWGPRRRIWKYLNWYWIGWEGEWSGVRG